MRKLSLVLAIALVAAACSSGSGSDTQTAGDGSGFCNEARSMTDSLQALAPDDPNVDPVKMFDLVIGVYKQLQVSAPGPIQGDIEVVIDGAEKYAEWAKDPTGTLPLDEAASAAFEKANVRVEDYLQEECGIDTGSGSDSALETTGDTQATASSGSQNQATHTISIGDQTYTEALDGDWEVSCDLIGDLESGSIDIYLDGPDFLTSVASYDSGIKPGSYEGQIFIYPSDDALDAQLVGLQEQDGTFTLDRAEEQPDGRWLFAGSFSGSTNDPPASLEASFTCVGPVDS